jgi:hypothetical protein
LKTRPNQSLEPTAGHCDKLLLICVKQFPEFATLAAASGAPLNLFNGSE